MLNIFPQKKTMAIKLKVINNRITLFSKIIRLKTKGSCNWKKRMAMPNSMLLLLPPSVKFFFGQKCSQKKLTTYLEYQLDLECEHEHDEEDECSDEESGHEEESSSPKCFSSNNCLIGSNSESDNENNAEENPGHEETEQSKLIVIFLAINLI